MNQSPLPPDPRSLPGRLGERYYVRSSPNTTILNITIALLYLSGIFVIALGAAIGVNFAASPMGVGFLRSFGVTPGLVSDFSGALIGMVVSLLYAIPIFARAQMLSLYIRIEENTRLTKELIYLVLLSTKK